MSAAIAVQSILLAMLLWVFATKVWPAFVLDLVRHRLFETRDEVFLLAAKGEIDLHDPAYQEFREHLNALIRYAHKVSIWTLIAGSHFSTEEFKHSWHSHDAPPGVQEKLDRKIKHGVETLLAGAILKTPLMALVFPVLVPLLVASKILRKDVGRFVRPFVKPLARRFEDLIDRNAMVQ